MEVLFGGVSGTTFFGDTWEWDGATWTKRSDTGPSARNAASMATLEAKGVLVGGKDSADRRLNDTWLWDGSWTLSPAKGPPVSSHAAMATLGNHAFHFGGADLVSETWAWDGSGWGMVAPGGPTLRVSHSMATLRGGIVLFGGTNGAPLGETWILDGTSWSQATVLGPTARQNHASATLL